jgi:hypothetical protein
MKRIVTFIIRHEPALGADGCAEGGSRHQPSGGIRRRFVP